MPQPGADSVGIGLRRALLAVGVLLVTGCGDAGTVDGGDSAGTGASGPDGRIVSESTMRAALDSGNVAYRAGRFDAALRHYRSAATAAPTAAAPRYGILMAARKLGDTALADSASAAVALHIDTTSVPPDSVVRAPRRAANPH